MSEIADRYRRLAADFTKRVAAVPAGDPRWSNPSPCEGWTARDVVQHLLDTTGVFFGLIGLAPPTFPPVDPDPAAAWAAARDAVLAALEDDAVAGTEFDGMFGRTRWDEAVDRFITADVLIHAWDLARAFGIDHRLPPEEMALVRSRFEAIPEEALRGDKTLGPALEPPADADEQGRFLAFLGRDPRA